MAHGRNYRNTRKSAREKGICDEPVCRFMQATAERCENAPRELTQIWHSLFSPRSALFRRRQMRVLVCGGRDFNDAAMLSDALAPYRDKVMVVIHGDAAGADYLAGKWGRKWGAAVLPFPADWERHGRTAGPIRNQQMLDEGKPDIVIAFPGGRGTADMVRRAKAAGVPVREVPPLPAIGNRE